MSRFRDGVAGLGVPLTLMAGVTGAVLAAAAYDDAVISRVVLLALINMVFVIGLYIFSGLSGTLSFGHMSFAAIGAYTCAYITMPPATKAFAFADFPSGLDWVLTLDVPYPLAIPIAGAVAALFALIVAPLVVRLSMLQGAIATLALLVIVHTIIANWTELTRGQSSMIGLRADLGLYGALAMVLLTIAVAWSFTRSRCGLRLLASRDDRVAARSLGARPAFDSSAAWVLSAFVTGTGGALYAHFLTSFGPEQFYFGTAFVIIAMLLVGGMRTLTGAVVGTVVYSLAAELLRRVGAGDSGGLGLPAGSAEILLAALLLVILIKRPAGIVGMREAEPPPFLRRTRVGATGLVGDVATGAEGAGSASPHSARGTE